MKKLSKAQKQSRALSWKFYGTWAVLALIIAALVLIFMQYKRIQSLEESVSGLGWRVMLQQGEGARYKTPIIDVAANRVYIPEARIYVTLDETSRNLRYEYIKASSNNPSEQATLNLSLSGVVGGQSQDVHESFSCDRIVVLNSSNATIRDFNNAGEELPAYTKTGSLNESTGFTTIHAHAHCKMYQSDTVSSLTEVAKTAKSY